MGNVSFVANCIGSGHLHHILQHLLAVPAAGRAARVVAPEECGVVRVALAAVLPAPRRVLGHGVVGDARAVLGRARVLAADSTDRQHPPHDAALAESRLVAP